MTSPALNNREELDKAVIAAQGAYDRLGERMAELQRLQVGGFSDARIGNVTFETQYQAACLQSLLAAVFVATLTPETLTFNAGKAEPWTVADEGIRQ